MNSNFIKSFIVTLISIACVGHFFQSVTCFPNGHIASSYQTSSSNNNNNNNNSSSSSNNYSNGEGSNENENNDNDDDNNDHITIDLPISPSAQAPTLITYIDDSSQFQTLHSDGSIDNEGSSWDNTDSSSNERVNVAPTRHHNSNNNNNVLRTFPSRHQVVDESQYDTLISNQAVLPPTRPTDIPINSLLKRLSQLLERRRHRQRRIQSFRRAILRGTGRSIHTGHNSGYANQHASNSAHSRRLALQAFRRRFITN